MRKDGMGSGKYILKKWNDLMPINGTAILPVKLA